MFEEPQARRPVVASKLLMRIDNMDYEGLEGPILEEEVTKAMSGLGDDKAPRTDGFSLAFWKFFWSIVSGEVMQVLEEFHLHNVVVSSLNANFLVLIPKKGGAGDIQDFRSISLVGSLYKILAKVLTNRLKKVISKMVSNSQNAFVGVGGMEDVDKAVVLFGCNVGRFPTSYLHLPFGAPHRSIGVWDVIEERFKRKLVAWKKQYLSKGDRLVLIKSTLSSLPIYFMPFFVIPKKVNQVRENSKELLWRDTEERRKFHLVNWVEVCKNKKHGGLGLRHLEGLNQAFLGKWLWRFSLERESLWRKVILGKFGEVEGGWITREAKIALNLVVNNFWVGLGVPGFNEKSSPIIEIQGTGEEENNNLAVGSDLLILVYLGRAQLKDFQR
uniref:Uncharacterized protein n=1 Tax=Vitis vinifera TaxID=29760 RepID=A5AJS1_VITVI|nr:hypothetical protein VITISV_037499 [Vitis vinifera]